MGSMGAILLVLASLFENVPERLNSVLRSVAYILGGGLLGSVLADQSTLLEPLQCVIVGGAWPSVIRYLYTLKRDASRAIAMGIAEGNE